MRKIIWEKLYEKNSLAKWWKDLIVNQIILFDLARWKIEMVVFIYIDHFYVLLELEWIWIIWIGWNQYTIIRNCICIQTNVNVDFIKVCGTSKLSGQLNKLSFWLCIKFIFSMKKELLHQIKTLEILNYFLVRKNCMKFEMEMLNVCIQFY